MRILVIGAAGMLGHTLIRQLEKRGGDVRGTVRGATADYQAVPALAAARLIGGVDVVRLPTVTAALAETDPAVVVNCAGIVKQREEAHDPVRSIEVNALFPHRLARLCAGQGRRLIHISTDCVFSGLRGPYDEEANPDPVDLYGRSKALGEVVEGDCLTLRTSIIGRELANRAGLLEWFLSQRGGRVRGFTRALYSGLTTQALADVIGNLIFHFGGLRGLWHVSGDDITKYDLLRMIDLSYRLGIAITRDNSFVCDRRLDSARFRDACGWLPPSWEDMIERMRADPTPYPGF
jgi:dTDP-4-dehydrorhamnose reductase